MKKGLTTLAALMSMSLACVSGASAASFDMAEWATNIDGTYTDHSLNPNQAFSSPWSWTFNFSGAGGHKAILFVDPEIDQNLNTWFNEFGAEFGSLATGQSWEIDEPGWVFGDILTNVQAGTLDNTNAVPGTAPDDVSMALGWDFTLVAGETAQAKFFLSDQTPTTGFYLAQTDPDSQATLYFSSQLIITSCPAGQCGPTVPEPSTAWLLGPVLGGLLLSRRKARKAA